MTDNRERIEFWFAARRGDIACASGWMDSPTSFGISTEAEHATERQFTRALVVEFPTLDFAVEQRDFIWFAGPRR